MNHTGIDVSAILDYKQMEQQILVNTILSTQTVYTTWIKIQNTTVQKEGKPMILFMLNGGLIKCLEEMKQQMK